MEDIKYSFNIKLPTKNANYRIEIHRDASFERVMKYAAEKINIPPASLQVFVASGSWFGFSQREIRVRESLGGRWLSAEEVYNSGAETAWKLGDCAEISIAPRFVN